MQRPYYCKLRIEKQTKVAHRSAVCQTNEIKLPPIETPKFHGEWQKWTSFIESFNSMIHNYAALAPLHRLHYLKACLEGPVSDVIRSIPTTGENYLQACNTLLNKFENRGAIIQAHTVQIRSLLDTKKISIASTTALQELHHHITSNVNALKALDQPVDAWDAWLVTLRCSRMDSITLGEWHLSYNNKNLLKFEAVEKLFFNRIADYEASDISTHHFEELNKTSMYNKNRSKKVFLANSKIEESGKTTSYPRCNMCAGAHRIPDSL